MKTNANCQCDASIGQWKCEADRRKGNYLKRLQATLWEL